MMRAALSLILALVAGLSHAQSALPVAEAGAPGARHELLTRNGACVWWYIYPQDRPTELAVYCAAVTEFAKIGGRLQTIVNAADPLRSLQTLPKRIAMSRIDCPRVGLVCTTTDPALQAVVADLNVARGR